MKKLLATLLVALMIMSCMTVVSFAAAEASTISEYPYADMSAFDESVWDSMDPVAVKYLATFRAITGLTPPNANQTPIYSQLNATNTYFNNGTGAMGVMPAYATPKDLVYIPVSVNGDGATDVAVRATFDENYLEPVVDPANTGATVIEMSGDELVASSLNADNVAGVHFYLIFKIKADAKGDAGLTTTTTQVDLNFVDVGKYTMGNEIVNVKLGGLIEGEAAEAPKMEAEDVEAIEASKIVYAGEDTFANFKNAYGLGEDVAADYTEEMSYVCAFGTVDTTKEADEYGFKLTTSYGKVIKGKAVNVVGGKFGIVFYGADYVIEGATIEAYAIVDGNEL